jgi:hypothetical protein
MVVERLMMLAAVRLATASRNRLSLAPASQEQATASTPREAIDPDSNKTFEQ